ncbi:DUF1887 family protein [Leptolyngbya sp. FACHB-711]|nr:DUF1887 family protein [Leptolyngbya sp. FACHB-711]
MIHTKRTHAQAHYLANVLQEFSSFQPAELINLGESHAEASVIRQEIQTIAKPLTGRVGMNYTGGTKVMAVHAYRAIEAVQPNAEFSYLDSNTLELMIDEDVAPSLRFKVSPPLTLEQLFRLHGLSWQPNNPPGDCPIQPEAATRLVQFYQSHDLRKAWQHWCHRTLRPQTKDAYNHWRTEAELEKVSPLAIASLPSVIREDLFAAYLHANTQELWLQAAPKLGFNGITQFCAWLNGTWLEHYTLSEAQRIAPLLNIHDSRISFNIRDPLKPYQDWAKFEFDVAFMQGYHLFALSCTTATGRSQCKEKLMEASVRARQLGGSEARIALVCCYQHPDSLRSELEVATRNRRIAVFGRSDLPILGQKIVNWVKQNG